MTFGVGSAVTSIAAIGFCAGVPLTVYHIIQMARIANRKPGTPFSTNVFVNTFNAITLPADLTKRGRFHRRRLLQSIALLVGSIALMIIVGR
jgi:hypothetical protein